MTRDEEELLQVNNITRDGWDEEGWLGMNFDDWDD